MLCGTMLRYQAQVEGRPFELIAEDLDGTTYVVSSLHGTRFAGPVRPLGMRLSPVIRTQRADDDDHDDPPLFVAPVPLHAASGWETIKSTLARVFAALGL
jgi:hypothetical protein